MLDHANEDCKEIEHQIEGQLRLLRKACKATRRLEVDRFCFGLRSGHREIDRALESLNKVREDVEKYQACLAHNGNSVNQMFVSNDLFRIYEVVRCPCAIEKRRPGGVREEETHSAGEARCPDKTRNDWEPVTRMREPEAAELISGILKASGLPESLQLDGKVVLDLIDFILNE
jgi:hypothetical protein